MEKNKSCVYTHVSCKAKTDIVKKTSIFIFILLASLSNLFGQRTEYSIKFEPLYAIDTVFNKSDIKNYQLSSKIRNINYFLLENQYKDGLKTDGWFLFKKHLDYYVVYDLSLNESVEFYTPTAGVKKILSYNEKYILIESKSTVGTQLSMNEDCHIQIVNTKDNSFIFLQNGHKFSKVQYSNDREEIYTENCISDIILENNLVTVIRNCTVDGDFQIDCTACFPSGVYLISDGKLRKIKEYSNSSKLLKPVIWVDKIHSGMTILNLSKAYPDAILNRVPLFEYGYDSEELGYEISFYQKVQFFVTIHRGVVEEITIVNSKYAIEGIDSEMTLKKVLEKIPNSVLHIDLISNWEYIYVKEHNLKLIFKTDSSNRLGIYEDDFEKGAVEFRKIDKKIDLIQIIKKPSS